MWRITRVLPWWSPNFCHFLFLFWVVQLQSCEVRICTYQAVSCMTCMCIPSRWISLINKKSFRYNCMMFTKDVSRDFYAFLPSGGCEWLHWAELDVWFFTSTFLAGSFIRRKAQTGRRGQFYEHHGKNFELVILSKQWVRHTMSILRRFNKPLFGCIWSLNFP